MASPPSLPPGSPPKPPPRRVRDASDPAIDPTHNPFMAADPSLAEGPAQHDAPANPFLAASPAPAAGALDVGRTNVRPEELDRSRDRAGVGGPSLRDPHADFRKGTWKKPVILLGVAALTALGLFFGLPSGTADEKKTVVATPEVTAVIGRSVGPEIIPDPDQPSLAQPSPPPARSKVADEPGESPDRPDQSGSFASMFKAKSQ